MGRLAAIFGGLLALLLIPLALAPTTSWMLLPGHLAFTLLACAAALGEGWAGHPGRARAWGGGYLVASVFMVAGIEVGARVFGAVYAWTPWTAALIWGWLPPVASGVGGALGEQRRRHLASLAIQRRKGQRPREAPRG